MDVELEKSRMLREIDNLEKIILSIEYKLNNERFILNAPPEVVEGARAQLVENQLKLKESTEILNSLSSVS